jgi:hypothetical protein
MNLGDEESQRFFATARGGISGMTLTPTRNLVISPSSRNQGTKWRWGAQGDDKHFSSSIDNCHRGKYSCPGFF